MSRNNNRIPFGEAAPVPPDENAAQQQAIAKAIERARPGTFIAVQGQHVFLVGRRPLDIELTAIGVPLLLLVDLVHNVTRQAVTGVVPTTPTDCTNPNSPTNNEASNG